MRLRLFAPLRAKVTSSAQSLSLPILKHDELASSLDHLVGASKQRRRNLVTERLCGRKVYDEIELSRLLDRDISRLRAAQNLVDMVSGASIHVREVCSIGHQTSHFDPFPELVHRRQSRGQRQRIDAKAVGIHERVKSDIKRLLVAIERLGGRDDVFASPNF